MNKFLKWLIVIVPFVLILMIVIIASLLTNKVKEEEKVNMKQFTTKDSRVTFEAYETYKQEEKGEYDLYLNKNNKQVVGVFSYNLSDYEEKTAKEVLDKQVNAFIQSRKDMKLFKKETTIDMEDKTILKVEYSGKSEKSSTCVYIFSVISFKADTDYILYSNEVMLKSAYEENKSEMINILKSAKLN